jgi:hypothetical protein
VGVVLVEVLFLAGTAVAFNAIDAKGPKVSEFTHSATGCGLNRWQPHVWHKSEQFPTAVGIVPVGEEFFISIYILEIKNI